MRPSLLPASAGERLLIGLGRRITRGSLDLTLPDGRTVAFQGSEPGPAAVLEVRSHRFTTRLLTGGDLGFGEAFVEGDCDSPDISRVVELAAVNYEAWERELEGKPLFRGLQRAVHVLRPNSTRGARKNIARHYDLGNAFYEAWLDPSMTYSSAIFEEGTQDLEAAQHAKYRRIAEAANLAPGQRVLEVGCGWGGFSRWAARELDCEVTGITISAEQYAFASEAVKREGLEKRVEIRRQDYRETAGRFDRIVSIEMLEAVGERYWPVYFRKLRDNLEPGGQAAIQVITIGDQLWESYRRSVDFIQRHVFPGGLLPSLGALKPVTEEAGLAWREERAYGLHYARTLEEWQERFQAAWPTLRRQGFDERFRRVWTYYLAYCAAGFRAGRIDVNHLVLART